MVVGILLVALLVFVLLVGGARQPATRPAPDAVPFFAGDEFVATPAERAELAEVLRRDPRENLTRRHAFFRRQDPPNTRRWFGFVPLIIEHGFTCVAVPGEPGERDLVYSVGFFYTFGHPELMLVADGDRVRVEHLHAVILAVGALLAADVAAGPDAVSRLAVEALEAAGLSVTPPAPPDAAFLAAHAYGYGLNFYAHFADSTRVDLLAARVR
jgi:hypothetical protein